MYRYGSSKHPMLQDGFFSQKKKEKKERIFSRTSQSKSISNKLTHYSYPKTTVAEELAVCSFPIIVSKYIVSDT